jgi:hypothetical protein
MGVMLDLCGIAIIMEEGQGTVLSFFLFLCDDPHRGICIVVF